MAQAYVPGEPGMIFLGTMLQGIGRSAGWGAILVRGGREVGSAINALVNHPQEPTTLYAAGEGLFVSQDLGESWQKLESCGKFIMAVAIDPNDPQTILVADQDGAVYRSTDGGKTWGG